METYNEHLEDGLEDGLGDVKRHVEENIYNYTPLELAQREREILAASKDFPDVPEKWIEQLLDFIKQTPKEEIEDIINNKRWENKPKERPLGDYSNSVSIEDNLTNNEDLTKID